MDTFLSKFARDPEYGDEVNLRCDSGGIPVPAITWFKDRERIEASDDKHQIKVCSNTSFLAFQISEQSVSNPIVVPLKLKSNQDETG